MERVVELGGYALLSELDERPFADLRAVIIHFRESISGVDGWLEVNCFLSFYTAVGQFD